jgi:hypothetical protein
LVRFARVAGWVLAAALLVLGGVWVWTLQTGPTRAVAQLCATGPWAAEPIAAAGGPDGPHVDEVLSATYARYPGLTRRYLLPLRAATTGAGDDELHERVARVLMSPPEEYVERLYEVERGCVARAREQGMAPDPPRWAIPDP